MTTSSTAKVSAAEYLLFEDNAETRHELVDGKILARSDNNYTHVRIADNLLVELDGQLMEKDCRVYSSLLRIKAELAESYFYPDLTGICGKPTFENDSQMTVLNPVILFEVLSPSTEPFDRGRKFMHYQQIPTLKEYVLVAQTHYAVEIYSRGPNGEWTFRSYLDAEETARFESIDCSVKLEDIYRDVTLKTLVEEE